MRPGEDPNLQPAPDDAPIAPYAYAPPEPAAAPRRRPRTRETAIAALLCAGLLFLWFLLGVRAVELRTDPADAVVDIDGGVSLRIGSRALLRPGEYRARADAPGYTTLEREFTVDEAIDQHLELRLVPLPGRLRLRTTPVSARVLADGAAVGESNGEPLVIAAGAHTLRLEADRYLPLEHALTIEGRGREQALELVLEPAFGTYAVTTEPPGARVLADGTELGTTPADVELLAGTRALRIVLDGYRDETLAVEARAGERRALPVLALARADARVRVSTTPGGATITLDGVFQGNAPLELALAAGTRHELIAFKAGYERETRSFTAARGTQDLALALRALRGEVRLVVTPPDAGILSGGQRLATGSATLRLPATAQRLSVRREGYATQEISVTPRPGFPQELKITLEKTGAAAPAGQGARIRSAAGQELVLLSPAPFHMGSSRREPGRRANELLHEVRPRRPFYLGVTEVTNAEFRQFRPGHSSGNFKGKSLNGDEQPAANLAWSDAALYCNWLSERDGLKPFYRVSGRNVIGVDAVSTGYRLPTEAEWAWAATLTAEGKPLRFPWGEALPPPAKSGNYADKSGESLLGTVIAGYDDGFAVSAPVRRFAPDRHGLFDIGGNVAEWVHDLYEASPAPGAAVDDPLGPDIGEYHVVRGSSWRHGGVAELRLAWRDYGKEGRADVGFRIARYAR
jgi:formylglycine-generating enzyme required for sulfatase activity